jgi:membrane-associated protease RseP (regulator of RpoE activity)
VLEPLVWQPAPKFQDRVWLHVLLFTLTLGTTTLIGAAHYASYLADFTSPQTLPMPWPALLLRGFWYSGTILAILGCHELGHYLACRYYDVDASRPFFLPLPPPFPTGTLGAFIRIREQIPQKRMLFDIGIAGPIAGFAVAVPALFIGMAMSRVVPTPAEMPPDTMLLGEPLLFQFAEWVFWRHAPETSTLSMHPVAFAAWFGLLATALNLMPVGQLDGGHISYAVLGRVSSHLTLVMVAVALALGYFEAPSWYVWSGLMIAMLYFFGRHHPPVFDEDVPLDPTRRVLAVLALVMLVLCFTPAPMRAADIIGR